MTMLLAMPQRRNESCLTSDPRDRQHLVLHQICCGKSCHVFRTNAEGATSLRYSVAALDRGGARASRAGDEW